MPLLELSGVDYFLDDGRQLLRNIELRLGEGERRALIGPNGVGKTTLLRILIGALEPHEGVRSVSGSVGVMSQFIGQAKDGQTIEDLFLDAASVKVSEQARTVRAREQKMIDIGDERSQLAYAEAIIGWGDVGGYEEEVRWDDIVMRTLGVTFEEARRRPASHLSGGEQKRLVLEALASGPHDILILDEPDNYLDVDGKRWLETLIREVPKSVLFVTHDREIIANAATSIATLERSPAGATIWIHGGGYRDYAEQRTLRMSRAEELRRRWNEDEQQLKKLVLMYREKAKYNSDMAKRYQAAQTRLERFRAAGPPEVPQQEERLKMRFRGGRTAKRAVRLTDVAIPGLLEPFSSEIWFGDRVAILGPNGSGKSHLLRLIAGGAAEDEPPRDVEARRNQIAKVPFTGTMMIGSRVRPGYFVQTLERPDLVGRTLLQILHAGEGPRAGLDRAGASAALNRYGLVASAENKWEELSGGQRARLQILLLDLAGVNLLLLDEPTDNLDIESADALETALKHFEGTVITVTHDRWFARSFDRFWVVPQDGIVTETPTPQW